MTAKQKKKPTVSFIDGIALRTLKPGKLYSARVRMDPDVQFGGEHETWYWSKSRKIEAPSKAKALEKAERYRKELVDGAGGTAPLNSLSFSAAVSAMEKVFGIQAGHRLRLSTEGLKTTVDELGGIRVTSSETFTSGGHTFTVGTNHLSGSEALAFGARSSANQLLVLDAVMRKMASEEVLTHYSTVMAGLGRTIKTDFSAKQFAQLAKSASGWQTTTYAVTGTATGSGTALDADTAAAAKSRLESVLKGN